MRATLIEWDGTHLPKELQQLPPGRYLLAVPDGDDDVLSADEDAAVRLGLDDLAAGRVLPLDEVIREVRGPRRP